MLIDKKLTSIIMIIIFVQRDLWSRYGYNKKCDCILELFI